MIATSPIQWMKEVNIYKKWLLLKKILNRGKTYSGRPVENSPEFMPLDNALNSLFRYNVQLIWGWTTTTKENFQ